MSRARSVAFARRGWRWALLAVLAAVAALYATGWAMADDALPSGSVVGRSEVGGLSVQAARERLARDLDPRLDDSVRLVMGDRAVKLDRKTLGLDVDIAASVDQVPRGGSWNPVHLWKSVFGGGGYDLVVASRGEGLPQALAALANRIERPVVDGGIQFTGRGAVPRWPAAGVRLDLHAATSAVLRRFPYQQRVQLPVERIAPTIPAAQVARALDRWADPAISSSVRFTLRGESRRLSVRQISEVLSVVAEGERLVPDVDADRLVTLVQPLLRRAGAEPEQATVRIVDGRPTVVPGRSGLRVIEAEMASTFVRLLGQSDSRSSVLPTTPDQPDRSAADVKRLGVREVVSNFTTYYPHAEYRNVNIGRAAELIDGVLLEPGDTFSLNGTVGERTRDNGFTEGFIISDGVFKEDLGGGVSQVATTTFNAAFFAGLQDVEHKPHSFYIDRYPMGREATVAWPTVDLRFRNDTRHGVLIQTRHVPSTPTQQGAITVLMWSTKVWDIDSKTSGPYGFTSPGTRVLTGPDCVPNAGGDGFQVDVTRLYRRPGSSAVTRREQLHTTYLPADRVICQPAEE